MGDILPDWAFVAFCSGSLPLFIHKTLNVARYGRAIKRWPRVDATIGEVSASPQFVLGFDYDYWNIDVSYAYQYNATPYAGRYISVMDIPPKMLAIYDGSMKRRLEEIRNTGGMTKVYVNPAKPEFAVLLDIDTRGFLTRAVGLATVIVMALAITIAIGISPVSFEIGVPLGLALYIGARVYLASAGYPEPS